MAEKGTLILDQSGGESIATRDAMLPDNDSNPRTVQIMDMASRPSVFDAIKAGTGGDGYIRSIVQDSLILDPLPASISGNILDVSDAESVVVYAEIECDGTSGGSATDITITPIVMGQYEIPASGSGSATIEWDIACLGQPFSLHPVNPISGASAPTSQAPFLKLEEGGGGPETRYVTIAQVFPTLGAERIGFHVNISGTSLLSGKLFAFKSSGAGRNAGDDTDTNAGKYGGIGFWGENS